MERSETNGERDGKREGERERKCIANNLHNTVYKWVFYVYAMYKCCCFFAA